MNACSTTSTARRALNPARLLWAAVLALAGLSQADAAAAAQSYDFKDTKGVNNVVFKMDAPLEAINGSASGISGKVTFDPQNPAAITGSIVVAAASLHVPNPAMKDHMLGAQWMDAARHQEITFTVKEFKNAKTSGDTTTGEARGDLTLKGATREIVVPVRLTWLKDRLAARTNGKQQGDLLVIRAQFNIKRTDYGINPGAPLDKVADDIELTMSIAGAAPRS